jgi:hypothetical protein
MSTSPALPQLDEAEAGESTLFDSLARLVPSELQTTYYRVLAHTRTLGPDDEMLRILEAMGNPSPHLVVPCAGRSWGEF